MHGRHHLLWRCSLWPEVHLTLTCPVGGWPGQYAALGERRSAPLTQENIRSGDESARGEGVDRCVREGS